MTGEHVKNEAVAQIVAADVVIVNKVDLVTSDELASVRKSVGEWNSSAAVIETTYADVKLETVLDMAGSSLQRMLSHVTEEESVLSIHDKEIVTVAATNREPVTLDTILPRLTAVLNDPTKTVLRLKGILYTLDSTATIVQGVHRILSTSPDEHVNVNNDNANAIGSLSVVVAIGYHLNQTDFDHLLDATT